jgi:hypothetical protein
MENKIKFICNAVKWFDKINGNTYHSVRITRTDDGKTIVGQFQYGYGDHYRQTAIEEMLKAGWIHRKYRPNPWLFERENNYPIYWSVTEGLKRDCIANGQI